MAQITIYLDDEHNRRLKSAAEAEGVSVSRWIAGLIEEKTRTEWPGGVRELAGAWQDFPASDELRVLAGQDAPRELF